MLHTNAFGCLRAVAVALFAIVMLTLTIGSAPMRMASLGPTVANPTPTPDPRSAKSVARPAPKPRRSQPTVAVVSAASYDPIVAPESIAAAFGTGLATQTVIATDADPNTPGIQLPTELGGTTVEVNGRRAGLFFVSPTQINLQIPAAVGSGAATVVIRAGDGTVSNGTAQVSVAAPAIFTANGSGTSTPAGLVLRVLASGAQVYEPLAQFNPATGAFDAVPINLGAPDEHVFLILYLTGLRGAVDADGDGNFNEAVHILLGGNEITPAFAGVQGDFVGLDQINVEIPRSMRGRGAVNVAVNYSTLFASNVTRIEIAGTPQVSISSIAPTTSAAGSEITINGAGFATSIADNQIFLVDAQEQPFRAKLIAASANQLRAVVPFGAGSGRVLVRAPTGEALSAMTLALRTSISGVVTDASAHALPGVTVRLLGTNFSAMTTAEGVFLLADVPASAAAQIEVDATGLIAAQPFQKLTLPLTVRAGRDNQFPNAIALTRSTASSFGAEEAEPNALLAEPAQQTATITGLVVESDGVTPAPHALVTANGRAVFSDNLGRYVLAGVTGATAALDAAALRPEARVDRAGNPVASLSLPASGVRVAPNLILQSPTANRPPVLIAPANLTTTPGATLTANFIASDPDVGQTLQVTVTGAPFASVTAAGGFNYTLRVAPTANDGGPFPLTLTARDSQNAAATQTVALRVNRPPVAVAQTVATTEAIAKTITLGGSDPDGDTLRFIIVTPPARGSLSAVAGSEVTYIPPLSFSGADSFTFKANDGLAESAAATVTINVAAINDARRGAPLSAGVSVLMPGALAAGALTVAPLSRGISVLMPGGTTTAATNIAPLSAGVSVRMPGAATSAVTNVAPISNGLSVLMPGAATTSSTNVAPLSRGVSVQFPSATSGATTNVAPISNGVSVQFAAPNATGSTTVAPLSIGVSVQLNSANGASGNLSVAPISPGVSVKAAPAGVSATRNDKAKDNTRGKPPP